MNMVRKMTVCLLLAALLASLFALPAMADITSARNLGDGSVEIKWDNMDDMEIYMVSKMSDNFEADLKTYGYELSLGWRSQSGFLSLSGSGRMTLPSLSLCSSPSS